MDRSDAWLLTKLDFAKRCKTDDDFIDLINEIYNDAFIDGANNAE